MSARAGRLPALLTLLLTTSALFGQDTKPAQPDSKPPTAEALKRWVEQLGDFHFDVRQKASEKLTAAGLAALPYLQDATRSSDPEVVRRAWWIIDGWAGEGKIPALLFKLSDQSAPVRAAAADQLGKMGARAKEAVDALNDVTAKDASEIVRTCAREALKTIQSSAELKLEVVDLDCPTMVGHEVRYRIVISNQGTAAATTARMVVTMPEQIEVSRIDGPNFRQDGQRIVSIPQTLDPGAKLQWDIVGKAVKAGAVPVTVELLADQLARPLTDTQESLIVEMAKDK
jgi:CheY-like chemotaxis protein